MTALERIIRPIVEGQIRDLIKSHPSILAGVDWYVPRDDKAATLVNSLAKRIVRDLTCEISVARLRAALLEVGSGTSLASSVECCNCHERGRGETDRASAPKATRVPGRAAGGVARAAVLSSERRSEIARTAALARWSRP